MKFISLIVAALVVVGTLAGCDDANVAKQNVKKAADMFEVKRRVVFFNGITDTYLLSVEGLCSITDQKTQLEVICKVGDGRYKVHYLGLSDNVSYFVEQVDAIGASAYHYRVIFKPQTIIPDVDFRGDVGELMK